MCVLVLVRGIEEALFPLPSITPFSKTLRSLLSGHDIGPSLKEAGQLGEEGEICCLQNETLPGCCQEEMTLKSRCDICSRAEAGLFSLRM